ncbi:MAG TPA: hypothetical protein DIT65_05355, partial [Cryomorphaceae bacterium]|nr:hypothetical protein [Cryomorphaceae bacterium]
MNPKHTLGFLAGGYRNVAALKGIDLPKLPQRPQYDSLLIGWDAADWKSIYPLLQQGKMPALGELLHTGVYANLATLDPPISPMLWTSIATSTWPSAHGIHGFTEMHDGVIRAVRGSSIQMPTYFEYLENQGIPASSVAWWPSHPAKNSAFGAMRVSNLAVSEDLRWLKDGVAPKEHRELLASLLLKPEEIPAAAIAQFFPEMESDSTDDIVRSVLKITTHALNVQLLATFALDHSPGGHASVYFDALDHYKHLGMKYAPPQLEGVSNEDFARYQHIVESAYRFHDLCLGTLLDQLDPNGTAILISDHGFTSGKDRSIDLPNHAGAPALEHNFHGIFAAKGSLFTDKLNWKGLNLLDIAPIILAAHGLKTPKGMEGYVPVPFIGKRLPPIEMKKNRVIDETFSADEQLLQSLVDLGYLDEDQLVSEEGRLQENRYYLARSLRAERRLSEAWRVIEPLIDRDEVPERYLQLAASVLADGGKYEALEKIVQKADAPDNLIWSYYQALLTLKAVGSVKLPDGLSSASNESVVVLWGQLLLKAGNLEELIQLLDNDNHQGVDIWNLRARTLVLFNEWDDALDAALESLNLLFYQPALQGIAALCFSKLGMMEEAATAKALQMKLLEVEEKEPLFIVTGAPRSGTSLAMQLIEACGISAVSDGVRSEDEHNAKGYYEHERVRRWELDAEWLEGQRGKAIKIVEPLLRQAP